MNDGRKRPKRRRKKEILYKTFLIEMIDRLARRSYDADIMRKLLVIYAYDQIDDMKPYEIASLFRVSEGSIYHWIKQWNKDLVEGLENRALVLLKEKEIEKICKEKLRKGEIKIEEEETE